MTALIEVEVTARDVAGMPPRRTTAPAWKPEPMMVTGVPPREGPVAGEMEWR